MKNFKKIISIFLVVLLFCVFFAFTVFAETVNNVIDVDVAKIQIKYDTSSGVNSTPWYTLNPHSLYSPYGGIFQAVRLNDDTQLVDNAINWNMNTYFTNLKFKKNVEYRFKGYFVLPWNKVYDVDYCNVGALVLRLCDTTNNRNIRYQVDTSNATSLSSWTKKSVTSTNTADFGFYHFDFTFIPSNDFTGFFSSLVIFGLADPPNSGGYFGFSDLTLSYEVDSSQQIASSVDSIDNALTSDTYNPIDDSKVNQESELTAEIEDSTAFGRGQAIAIMDSTSDLQGSSIENGLLMWTNVLESVINRLPWFGEMLRFSLALGLFSFLMGIITYAVGKTSAKNRQQNSRPKSKNKGG